MSAESAVSHGFDDAPTAEDVADELGVDAAALRALARRHGDVCAAFVLGYARGDPAQRSLVAKWIAARRRRGETA